MTTIEGPHTHLRHEDKFLRTIHASLYYGKGYPQYLYSENKEESIPVFATVKEYILQDRPHLKGTHPIYNRMLREGILKVPVLYAARVIYANYASRFFYTFAKLCGNRIFEEVVTNHISENLKIKISTLKDHSYMYIFFMEYSLHGMKIIVYGQIHELGSRFQSDIVTRKVLYDTFFFRSARLPLFARFVRVPIGFLYTLC